MDGWIDLSSDLLAPSSDQWEKVQNAKARERRVEVNFIEVLAWKLPALHCGIHWGIIISHVIIN